MTQLSMMVLKEGIGLAMHDGKVKAELAKLDQKDDWTPDGVEVSLDHGAATVVKLSGGFRYANGASVRTVSFKASWSLAGAFTVTEVTTT